MSEKWKPERGAEYFVIHSTGSIKSLTWQDTGIDRVLYAAGNCFRTKKEATNAAKKVKKLLLSLDDNDEKLQDNIQDMVTNTCQAMDKGKENVAKATCTFGNLPKLTAEVFDHPDCPKWAKYAAVDLDGMVCYFDHKPEIAQWSTWWERNAKYCPLSGRYDASDWENSLIERPVKETKLPDWCKVGEWVWAIAFGVYFKVDKVDGLFIYGTDFSGSEYSVAIKNVRQAHPRPYNEEEMQELIGKVVSNEHGNMFLVTAFVAVNGGEVCVDGIVYNADDLFECYTINGRPCGVLEHLDEKGEWVE